MTTQQMYLETTSEAAMTSRVFLPILPVEPKPRHEEERHLRTFEVNDGSLMTSAPETAIEVAEATVRSGNIMDESIWEAMKTCQNTKICSLRTPVAGCHASHLSRASFEPTIEGNAVLALQITKRL